MFFDKVFVVGSGSICISIIKSLSKKGIKPVSVLYKEHHISSLSMFLKNKNIEYYSFDDKNDINNFFENITNNTLIFSFIYRRVYV